MYGPPHGRRRRRQGFRRRRHVRNRSFHAGPDRRGDDGIDRVDIYLVDTVCRMAVFAFSNDRKTERFQSLYVPFETGLEMDMIDFHSLELPDESEVEWDETDFEALISGAVPLRETDPKTDKTNNE